jgi:hypothetical protein
MCISSTLFNVTRQEAVTGEVSPGNDEFQQGIRRAVPLGWLFKGFPLHQRHLSVKETAAALLAESQAWMMDFSFLGHVNDSLI